ncbi:MAG: hypothetical protein HYX26_08720 [Acidobacteriales bacterium]|nr:hypothetical protein [Terriglobales bacterium]
MPASEPFIFYTERRLVVLTGRKAGNLCELLQHLCEVSGASVFYHTHYLFLIHHFEKPRFYNDFANWVSAALQEEGLAERLAAIDLLAMTSIREVREAMLAALRNHLDEGGARRQCPPGSEFHFCEAKSFVMPTGVVARDAAEFFEQVGRVSNACLHFHLFESRLRLEQPANDFSQWLKSLGETRAAKKIDKLDPYVMTLDELKGEIVKLGRKYRRK